MTALSPGDAERAARDGIAPEELIRQLELLRSPPERPRVLRPCRPGDGIRRIDSGEEPMLLGLYRDARNSGRLQKLVPASGAATRMFSSLLAIREEIPFPNRGALERRARDGDSAAEAALLFEKELHRLPVADLLAGEQGVSMESALHRLLAPDELGLAYLPKGLIPFHRYPSGPRTAFQEHLVEGARYLPDATGRGRFHFTLPVAHRGSSEAHLERAASKLGSALGIEIALETSTQNPSTNTLALDKSGDPVRDHDGELILRPSGHGALLLNLNDLQGDIVFIKNIDNVRPERAHPLIAHWKGLLAGLLLALQQQTFRFLEELETPSPEQEALDQASQFARDELALEVPTELGPASRSEALREALHRPLRVCGVVPNRGEAGGGPFWVQDRLGRVSPQIVEKIELPTHPEKLLAAATHFNPVDVVCGLRDHRNRPYDLTRFADHRAVMVTRKAYQGQSIRVLERPGLWNGSMAFWNTVLVEVPAETFAPVKTVLDLLRPEHQA